MAVVERIRIPFEGTGAGVGDLSWGQQDIWNTILEQHTSLGVGGAFPLPAGKTVADVAADMGYLVSRHPSLRTRLRFGPDGRPKQVVSSSGEVVLEVVEADGDDPGETAEELYRQYHARNFEYETEWPIRWAVVCSHGKATHFVSEICHLALDGEGAMALAADMESPDRAAGRELPLVVAMQPLEQARWQASEAGQRTNQAALRYWEKLLRAIPARRFPGSTDERDPRYWDLRFDSPATHLAVQMVAARTRASSSTVLLAAAAVSFASVTGINPAVIRVEVDNRFRRGLADSVSPVGQSGICAIDVADATFDQVVSRAFRSAMGAYKHGYYNPDQLDALVARVGRERGEELDLECYVNDRRLVNREEPDGHPPAIDDVREALPHSVMSWGPPLTEPNGSCFLHINDVPGTMNCQLFADTRYMSPAHMEAYLRGFETVTVAAAADLAAPTGVSAQ
ncbi:MAG TPA: condensation domain-containing protein [Streptosporangiaceae bacterium]|nr:condensation domain-containing protein [Streptosporangiaceae bacterium]